jgi:hypothetical protein
MQRQRQWLLGLAAVVLVGCSAAIGPLAPPPVPDNPATAANVTVYRKTAPEDDALRMVFSINGAATYQLRPGDRYNFALGAGSYEFGYQMGMGNCSDPVQIDAGGNYVFKLGSGCAIVLESQ